MRFRRVFLRIFLPRVRACACDAEMRESARPIPRLRTHDRAQPLRCVVRVVAWIVRTPVATRSSFFQRKMHVAKRPPLPVTSDCNRISDANPEPPSPLSPTRSSPYRRSTRRSARTASCTRNSTCGRLTWWCVDARGSWRDPLKTSSLAQQHKREAPKKEKLERQLNEQGVGSVKRAQHCSHFFPF